MAGYTVTQAQAQLDAWLAASEAIAAGQSYSITTPNGVERTLTRANAEEALRMVRFWDAEVKRLSRTRSHTQYVVPNLG